MSTQQWSAAVDQILAYAEELQPKEDTQQVESEKVSDEPPSEHDGMILDSKALFGENGEGNMHIIQADDGLKLVYKGVVPDSNGNLVETKGVLAVEDIQEKESLFSSETQASFTYDADTHQITTTLQDENNYVVFHQDLGDEKPIIEQTTETIDGRESKTYIFEVRTFIPEKQIWMLFLNAGDNRDLGENGSSRTTQLVIVDVENGIIKSAIEKHTVGTSHKLDYNLNVVESITGDGESIKSNIIKYYSHQYKQEVSVVSMEGNEKNPLMLKRFPDCTIPGITYKLDATIDSNSELRSLHAQIDGYPAIEIMLNGEIIFSHKPWPIFLLNLLPFIGDKTYSIEFDSIK